MNLREVHVWRADVGLNSATPGMPELAPLDARERAQAAKLRRAADRRRYVASHAFLRRVLPRYVGVPAGELRFATGQYGKPALSYPTTGLAFNLSHSGSVALVAVAGGAAVGVDVEQARSDVDIHGLARTVFSEEERRVLRACDPALQCALFYRTWVCKEALLKACGAGLSVAPDRLTVLKRACSSDPCASLIGLAGTAWGVRLLDLGNEGYFAAIAAPADDWVAAPATTDIPAALRAARLPFGAGFSPAG
jgi:4'-phosphopantetheinyl transferase